MSPVKIGRRAIVIALMVLGASISGKADKVDDYITGQMQRLHIPGASLAIVRDGRLFKAQGYGLDNLELESTGDESDGLRNRLEYKAIHRRCNHVVGGRWKN